MPQTPKSIPDFAGRSAGRDFEKRVLERLDWEENHHNGTYDRSGVKAAVRGFNKDGTVIAQLQKSKPDFEGILPSGRPLIFDTKVITGPSFNMSAYRTDIGSTAKSNQYKYMLRRCKYGALCGFLIHFNSREFKRKKKEYAETLFLVVNPKMRVWREFEECSVTVFTRDDCRVNGFEVPWNFKSKLDKRLRPDLIQTILEGNV